MEPILTIEKVQKQAQMELNSRNLGGLKFKPPYLEKKNNSYVGNIIPKQAGRIWSGSWCFYQILIPKVPFGKRGEVNFICYTENQLCGLGIHTNAIWNIIEDFCAKHDEFNHNTRLEKCASVFKRYSREQYSEFPTELAVKDMVFLIENTFEAFDALRI